MVRRLADEGQINYQSWIDLFFTKGVYIFGLGLDFVESDLWWLLTYRARSKYYKNKFHVKNKISYFIPEEYEARSKSKLEVMRANDVNVVVFDKAKGLPFYSEIMNRLGKIERLCSFPMID